jgi:NitT/TauT family transport system permease protein
MKYVKGAIVVMFLWYVLALLVASPIVPFPHVVLLHGIANFIKEDMHRHILSSLLRILAGLALALTMAIPTGIAAGRIRMLDRIVSPVLYLLYPLPKIAFLPVFMVLFGIGDISKVLLISVIIFFPAAVTIRDGVKEIPTEYLELAKAYHLTRTRVFKDIVWPAILPRIFSSLRITLGISLSVLFIGETYAARYGLGYHIMNSWVMAQYVQMYASIMVLSLLGLLLYILVDLLERTFVHPRKK